MSEVSIKAKVTDGGRVVIPARFRRALGIEVGKDITITMKDGALRITTREQALKRIEQMMKDKIQPGRSVVDELIRERREEAERE